MLVVETESSGWRDVARLAWLIKKDPAAPSASYNGVLARSARLIGSPLMSTSPESFAPIPDSSSSRSTDGARPNVVDAWVVSRLPLDQLWVSLGFGKVPPSLENAACVKALATFTLVSRKTTPGEEVTDEVEAVGPNDWLRCLRRA
ncbi:hypothetical protein AG1IA_01773 [Rhizoctonia solani AG-1 IA]|uniref:Uncharacterized protein n=1 Tax=Thanatephorus cucumeris (strain AG1-IA) TaxID=983506 RepID=L8X588_THACA|nr:hypothetical protein AG1IA_01773 [Rhizoctonia solani AG-1 IA]